MSHEDERAMDALRAADVDPDLDERWQRLADGGLLPAEAAALQAEAMQTEEGRALWELFRPLTANESARVFEGVRARVRADRAKRSAH